MDDDEIFQAVQNEYLLLTQNRLDVPKILYATCLKDRKIFDLLGCESIRPKIDGTDQKTEFTRLYTTIDCRPPRPMPGRLSPSEPEDAQSKSKSQQMRDLRGNVNRME